MTRTSLFARLWPALLTLALVTACREPDAPSSSKAPPLAVSPENARAPFDLGSVVQRVHFAYRPGENGWTGGHSTYSVRVDARGLTVTPYHQPGGPGTELPPEPGHREPESRLVVSGAPATFGPALITRGTSRWETATGPGQVREDGSLSLPRGEVEERLRNDEEGIEQSWHFARAPGGQGELVVRLPVRGLGFAGETAQGLHFKDSRTGLGFRYGHATWTDASGQRTELRARYTADAIELRVPSERLSASAFPAALTPKLSPEIELDTPVTAPGGGGQERPAIAFDGKNYLVVWADSRGGSDWDIFGTRVSPEGVVLTPQGIPISTAGNWQQAPSVDFNGTNYLVVWQDARASNGSIHIYGARVSPGGAVLEPNGIPVATTGPSTSLQMTHPVVAHDRSRTFMVVWEQRSGGAPDIYGTRVGENGAVFESTPFRVAPESGEERAPAIATNGYSYLVVWEQYSTSTSYDIHGIQLDTAGYPYTWSSLVISAAASSQVDPAVAFDGLDYLVAWEDNRPITSPAGTGTNIFGARVSTGGSVLDPSGFSIIIEAGGQYDPAIAMVSGVALVTWGDMNTAIDILGIRVSWGGVLDYFPRQISSSAGSQLYPAVASDGLNNYFVVWQDARSTSNWDVYGTPVSYNGTPSQWDGVHLSPAPNSETTPVVATDGTDYLVVFTDNRSGSSSGMVDDWDLYGVRVSSTGSVLDPSGFLITNRTRRQRLPAVAFGGSYYLVAWEDSSNSLNGATDIYAARVSRTGKLMDANGISLSAWSGNESSPAIAFDGTNFLVVWTDASTSSNNNIFGNRVGQDGRRLDSNGFLISNDSLPDQRVPTVSWDGTNYLVVWHESHSGWPFQLRGARVTPARSVLDSSGFLISSSPNPIRYVSAAFDGTNHLVVWNDSRNGNGDVYAARVDKTGTVLDPSGLPIATGTVTQQRGSVAYNGTDFVVVWQEQRSGTNWDIYSTRVNGAGQVLDGTGLAISTSAADEVNPSVAAIKDQPWLVTYQVTDSSSGSSIQRIRARTVSLNTPPTANPRSDTLDEDTPTPITLSATDAEGHPLSYAVVMQPTHGTLSGTAPNLTYTPPRDYHGLDAFSFTASDGLDTSAPATVVLTINPVNDAPVAHAQSLSTLQDNAVFVTLSGSDVEGDTIDFALDSGPSHGTLTGTPPNLTYTPAAGFYGSDSFTFTVSDGVATSTPATVSLTVKSSNHAPVATEQSHSLPEDTAVSVTLSGYDGDKDPITFAVVSGPSHGTLTGTAPDLTYTPAADFHGTDSFTFTVSDAQATSAPATVSLTVTPVNDAPEAHAQSRSTPEDTAVSVTLSGSDLDGDSLSFAVATGPSHGTVSGTAPHLIYTPAANFHGTDSFTFTAHDGKAASAPTTVSLTVTPENDAPEAHAQSRSTPEDTAVSVTLTGSDVDGDSLSFTVALGPSHGTLTGTAPDITYTPAANFHGSDSITFTVHDGKTGSASATVSLTVSPGNDAPEAHAQSATTREDTAVSVTLSGSDVDGDSLTFNIANGPSHGTLSGTAPNLTYTPAADFHGTDSVTFTSSDGQATSAPATVSLTVTPENDAPSATAQSVTTPEDTAVSVTLTGSDVDGDSLTFTVATGPSHGTLSGTAPHLTYTPAADFHGSDSFTFTVSDAQATSAPATVSLSMTAGNDAPVANVQSVTTPEDTAVSVTLTGSDVDGDSLSFTVATGPNHGTLSGTAPDLTYTPAADFHGSDSITFTVHDGKTASASTTVSLSVSPANDAPVAHGQSLSVRPGHPLAIKLTGSDVDGDTLTFAVTSTPSPGTLTGVPPDLVYTAPKDFRGTVQLAFTAHDGQATSAPATVAISVSKQALMVNAVADSLHPRAGQPVRFHANVIHSDGHPLQLRWHFGDGESSTEELPLHAFASPGTYEVRLIATSGSTEATASLRLVVRDPEGIAIPGGAPDKPIDVDEGTSVTLVATEPLRPGTTITWDFGDGTELAAGNPVSHTYADDGHYVLRMLLLDESGQRIGAIRPVTVHNLPPVPMPQDELSVLPGVPIDIQLAASDSAGASDPLQWELLSGEGTVDENGRFSWTPPSAGLHTVEVKVSDDEEGASFLAFQLRVDERGVSVPEPSSGFGCGAGSSGVTAPLGLGLLLLVLRGRRRSRT